MQKEAGRHNVIPVRFGHDDVTRIDEVLQRVGSRSRSEFIREAVEYYLDNVAGMKVVELRSIGREQAKREILNYIRDKREAETFDIANDLRLDLDLTVKSLKELWEEGKVK